MVYFAKGQGSPLFAKGGVASTLFRKGYNTLGKVSDTIGKIGNISKLASPILYGTNPVLGGITTAIGNISPLIQDKLNDVVSRSKQIKNAIEKPRPKTENKAIYAE